MDTMAAVATNAHKNTAAANGKIRYGEMPPKLWTAEWRVLASVIDRLFFILYVIGIILSMIFVFPR